MELPIAPVVQLGIGLLGLIILVSLAFGWRRGGNHDDEGPKPGP
jgi:hypothetical protein